jgi:NAD(P)-dependent dehydrogenase (short-subunit alcohol dehydrogenase family)
VLNETADIWDNTIETHLNACFLLSQLAAKSMVKRKSGGKIINLASMYSIFGSGRCLSTAVISFTDVVEGPQARRSLPAARRTISVN